MRPHPAVAELVPTRPLLVSKPQRRVDHGLAIPTIEHSLHLSQSGVEWVVSAYILTFAGLLLAGGRLADVFGQKRLFVVGLSIFTAASLLAGLVGQVDLLIASRALQGLGAALLTPTTLAILSATYPEPREQARAVGAWSAAAASDGRERRSVALVANWGTQLPAGMSPALVAPCVRRRRLLYMGWSACFVPNKGVREFRAARRDRLDDGAARRDTFGWLLHVVMAFGSPPRIGLTDCGRERSSS